MGAHHHGRGPDRLRMIAPERVAQRGLSIPARCVLREDPEARERPQEPPQRRAVRIRGFCQFLDALGAAGDKIGKAELGGNMDRLHRHCSRPQELHHLHRWGDGLCLRFLVAHLCLSGMLSSIATISFRYGTPSQRHISLLARLWRIYRKRLGKELSKCDMINSGEKNVGTVILCSRKIPTYCRPRYVGSADHESSQPIRVVYMVRTCSGV